MLTSFCICSCGWNRTSVFYGCRPRALPLRYTGLRQFNDVPRSCVNRLARFPTQLFELARHISGCMHPAVRCLHRWQDSNPQLTDLESAHILQYVAPTLKAAVRQRCLYLSDMLLTTLFTMQVSAQPR